MKHTPSKSIYWTAVAIALMLPVVSCAQSTAPAASVDTTGASGLDSLIKANEPKVLDELQSDALDSLLTREFDVDNTPQKQRDAIESLKALRLLNDPKAVLSGTERLKLARQAAQGLQDARASLPHDAARLEKYAQTLYGAAVTYYESTLEYWGENAATQEQFKPIADTIADLYQMASDAAEAQCATAASANNLAQAQSLDEESRNDAYITYLCQYDRALAVDASTLEGKAERKKICDDALGNLEQYDDPANSVQPVVELNMGKLRMLEGDTTRADKWFDKIIANKLVPPATPYQINDAYYFKANTRVLAKDSAGATKAMAAMKDYQKGLPATLAQANVPQANIEQTMKEADTVNSLLQYRIDLLDNKLADAQTVLTDLKKSRPDLAKLIDEQLINCLPPDQPVAGMAPFLLNAVMNKAATEQHHKPADQDKKILQRGLDASKEVLTRKGDKEITPDFVLFAAKLEPVLQEALGNDVDSINGYLDFVDKYKTTYKDDANGMLQGAYALVAGLQKSNPEAAGLGPAYERFLKAAVSPPFNYTAFCYAYGLMLQGRGDLTDAADLYKRVPKSDLHYDSARYQLMLADYGLVNTPSRDQAAHAAVVNELATVSQEISAHYANATSKEDRLKGAYATMIAFQLALNDQHDPKTALGLEEGFDKKVAGLDQEQAFIVAGLFVRYGAHMELRQSDQATADLVDIMNKAPGDTGAKLVHDQLTELEKQFDKAQADDDKPLMLILSRNQAKLSGFLSDWAKNNTNPANRKAYYGYAVFDAKIKRIAGTLETDPAAKETDLKQALAQYEFLASPAGHALYVAQLDPAKVQQGLVDPNMPDTYVELGRALTQFELHDYADAQDELGSLLVNKRLGDTTSDSYWEATLKLYACNYELAQAKDANAIKNLDQTKRGLKGVYIIGGIPVKWQSAFDDLRAKLLPDWKVPDAGAKPQQSASSK
jgi:hypothetical protein